MAQKHGRSTPQVFIDELDADSAGSIVVTLCMMWDVKATNGYQLSTDFVVSDLKGNVIDCTAKASIAHNFHGLQKGVILSIKDFVVRAGKEDYRVKKNNTFMLEFNGKTRLRKFSVNSDEYIRYPLQLLYIDNIEPTRNKSLIDVAGYVTNIARMNHARTGSKNLEFYLSNHRGKAVRVTLWGGLGDLLIDKKMKHLIMCPIVINSTSARHYYSPSAMGIEEVNIPTINEFNSSSGGIKDCMPKDGTIKTLLMCSRNQTNYFGTFHLEATIGNIRTEKGWRFPSCGGEQCQKGVTRLAGDLWCDGCEKHFTNPDMRYRLALDVFDNTDKAVFFLFDIPAIQLLKFPASSIMQMEYDPSDERGTLPPQLANIIGTTHIFEIKSHTYYDHGIYESFICTAIVATKPSLTASDNNHSISSVEGCECWTMNADDPDIEEECSSNFISKINQDPSIATPSKSTENKRKKRCVMLDYDQKRKKTLQKQYL